MSDLLKKLREPFRKEELEFRVGATNDDKSIRISTSICSSKSNPK